MAGQQELLSFHCESHTEFGCKPNVLKSGYIIAHDIIERTADFT